MGAPVVGAAGTAGTVAGAGGFGDDAAGAAGFGGGGGALVGDAWTGADGGGVGDGAVVGAGGSGRSMGVVRPGTLSMILPTGPFSKCFIMALVCSTGVDGVALAVGKEGEGDGGAGDVAGSFAGLGAASVWRSLLVWGARDGGAGFGALEPRGVSVSSLRDERVAAEVEGETVSDSGTETVPGSGAGAGVAGA